MAYYIYIENNKINGSGQAKIIDENINNFEVDEIGYNNFIENPEKYVWDETTQTIIDNTNYEQEQAQARKDLFNNEFFLTSLGYIRRKVSMATGETKDFLCDLVPAMTTALAQGIATPIITYKEPDFTQEATLEYMVSLQEIKTVTSEFLQECALQLSKDFLPTPLIENLFETQETTQTPVEEI